ncbi:hypothetical protein HpBhutan27_10650 [Helicobacter pylori]
MVKVLKMYALAFDLKIEILKKEYGEPYNKAYDDLRQELELLGLNGLKGAFMLIILKKTL